MATRGRPTQAQRLGLDVELTEQPGGTWRAVVKDDDKNLLFDKDGYSSRENASRGVGLWVRREHGADLAPGENKRAAKAAKAAPSLGHRLVVADLADQMEQSADDQDNQAVALRQQADQLEEEAKRLRVAAEVLRGPDGNR